MSAPSPSGASSLYPPQEHSVPRPSRGSRLAGGRRRMSLPVVRRASGLLDGRNRSIFVGHGQDFSDLSLYRPGDDVEDIDWKATARNGKPVIKRFQRESNLPLVLALDTGRTMGAQAPSGEDKRDLALFTAEILAYLARMRGDTVAVVAGDAQRLVSRPPRSGSEHAEMILTLMARQLWRLDELDPLAAPASDVSRVLERVSTTFRRRSLVALVTDTSHPDASASDWLRRLSVQHELMVVQVADDLPVAPGKGRSRDVEMVHELPAFLREDASLAAEMAGADASRRSQVSALLDSRHLEHTTVTSSSTLVPALAELLRRQRLASSRRRRVI